MEITDIHCHILPGLDDGAENEEESIKLLKMAFAQGIHQVIAASHASEAFPKSHPEAIRRSCERLEQIARKEIHPSYRIFPGQEILFTESVLERMEKGELLTLADSSYILIEFYPNAPYQTLYRAVRELAMSPYHPILAHFERYLALREGKRVEELIHAGAYMQMNYRPIGGRWYDRTTRWCRLMLEEGNVHFLGTDMHQIKSRPPRTEEAMRWMQSHLELGYVEDICNQNAENLLQDIRI